MTSDPVNQIPGNRNPVNRNFKDIQNQKENGGLFEKLSEVKVFRDPIHVYIHVEYTLIWKLIGAREFQRLRRIRQLGGDVMVYHTGDHSRFAHSLGVYEMFRRMACEVPDIAENLSEHEKIAGYCAALLHDIGHGPYSHYFERITGISHEEMSMKIILDLQSEIHQILSEADPNLADEVVSILNHTHPKRLLCEMISSQLDADRMDYLLRDAYFTGTQYGNFDRERILRTMRVKDGHLCIKYSGVRAVEDYILSRSQMYWQVYLHPDAFGYELLITNFFERYKAVRKECPIEALEPLFDHEHSLDVETFFWIDENVLQYGFLMACRHPDPVLFDLGSRIINRKTFEWFENPADDQIEKARLELKKRNLPELYYFYIKKPVLNQVYPYREENNEGIQVIDLDGSLRLLSEVSVLTRALLSTSDPACRRLYCA